jgi:hypothetical protein
MIFVKGNEDTGYIHLSNRHSFGSFKNYWRQNDLGDFKLDNPSKFNPNFRPMIDYINIADEIFCEENKNITKNNRPELFDKYTGFIQNLESEKYHLLTYKDTKIVHTLFPDKKKHNQKIKCKFGKGVVFCTYKFPEMFDDMLLPYENSDGAIVYSILIRKYLLEQLEKLIIQKHNKAEEVEQQFILAQRPINSLVRFEKEDMFSLQYGDVSSCEKMINDIDNSKIEL